MVSVTQLVVADQASLNRSMARSLTGHVHALCIHFNEVNEKLFFCRKSPVKSFLSEQFCAIVHHSRVITEKLKCKSRSAPS